MSELDKLIGRAGNTDAGLCLVSGLELGSVKEEIDTLRTSNKELRDALEEIAEGKGEYDMDPLTHAGNTIREMVELATEALKAKP